MKKIFFGYLLIFKSYKNKFGGVSGSLKINGMWNKWKNKRKFVKNIDV